MAAILETFRKGGVTTVTHRQQAFMGAVVSILANIVVLNLFVEYAEAVVIDRFTISILTAILLTLMLWVITGVEQRVHHFFFDEQTGRGSKVLGVVAVWTILFGSKFLILEVVDIVFGEHVQLGHFLEVLLIVVAMLGASEVLTRLYDRLGTDATTDRAAA